VKLVIMQPSYLPWLGYFDLLFQADHFLLYDNVQFDKDGWRNRNRIKTPNGAQWLTVPVLTKGMSKPTNREVRINDKDPWQRKHLKGLEMNYRKSPFFDEVYPMLESLLAPKREFLIDLNRDCLNIFCDYLDIQTPMGLVSELSLSLPEDPNQKLVEICRHQKADEFYEPQGGAGYIDPAQFEAAGIRLTFQDYVHPIYPQLHGDFLSQLSCVDLFFNCGREESRATLKGALSKDL